MEKLKFRKLQESGGYKIGLDQFHKRVVPPTPPVVYGWYHKIVSGKEWADKKYKDSEYYIILDMKRSGNTITDVDFAFLSAETPDDCLEITDQASLDKIKERRMRANQRPFI